ncbi:DUF3168 domain-containing protein [Puniceibacterium sp. IMCC21224]|uniref:DUF3168 domain-containing protein n=1 Tax=Puniceibacterium sp. IMCC21224 TaxID=1618204 RepID=UPI00064DF705|nr:DUF3168 domain-containing protein [Puniceibacterium sp. IMCC21224]KMK67709.1 Protein of unknown function (DUF3168) [Puniceibacterium sp. IMCC21224]
MSYANAAALQSAVYQALVDDPGVSALVGGRVYDALPSGQLPALYVTLGAEKVRDASDTTGNGAWHDLTVAVVTSQSGFQVAKETAVAISDALNEAELELARGRLVGLRFLRAQARRESGGLRRIEMTFRARVEDN